MGCCDSYVTGDSLALEYTSLIGCSIFLLVGNYIVYLGQFFTVSFLIILIATTFGIPAVRSAYRDRCFAITAAVFSTIGSLTALGISLTLIAVTASRPIYQPRSPDNINVYSSQDDTNTVGFVFLILMHIFGFVVATIMSVKYIRNSCKTRGMHSSETAATSYNQMNRPFMSQPAGYANAPGLGITDNIA